MSKFRALKGSGVWPLSPQPEKYGYINNPRWTEEMAHEDDHLPCGYWPKDPPRPSVWYPPVISPIWEPSAMCLDVENRLLYTTCVRNTIGHKHFRMVFATNIDTMRHVRTYRTEAPGPYDFCGNLGPLPLREPYFDDTYATGHMWYGKHIGDSHYVPVGRRYGNSTQVVNTRTNIIHTYGNSLVRAENTLISVEAGKIFIKSGFSVGYYPLEGGSFIPIVLEADPTRECSICNNYRLNRWREDYCSRNGGLAYSHKHNMVFLSGLSSTRGSVHNAWGHLIGIRLPGFGWKAPICYIRDWFPYLYYRPHCMYLGRTDYASGGNFPLRGLGKLATQGDYLYGIIRYDAVQPHIRGLFKLHIPTRTYSYSVPSYAPDNLSFNFMDIYAAANGKVYLTHRNYGIAEYTPSNDSWRLLNDWTIPGMSASFSHLFQNRWSLGFAYDPVTANIFCGYGYTGLVGQYHWSPWSGCGGGLDWGPTTHPSAWACWIVRHSTLRRPQEVEHVDDIPKYVERQKRPMIWTMPDT